MEKRKIGNLVTEGIPEIPLKVKERLEEYRNTKEAQFLDWLDEEEGLLISTRSEDSAQIHAVRHPGSAMRQLTFFSEPIMNAKVRPNSHGQQFIFSKDQGGDEAFQLYLFDTADETYELLTDGVSKSDYPLWNHRGDCLVYTTTTDNGADMNPILCFPGGNREDEQLFRKEGYWYPLSWSKDDRYLAMIKYISIEDSQLYIYDLLTKNLIPAYSDHGQISCRHAIWSPAVDTLFYTCNVSSQFLQLFRWDWTTGEKESLFPELQWDIESLSLSQDGQTLAFTVNEEGYSALYLMDVGDLTFHKVPAIPPGLISGLSWHPQSARLAFSLNTATAPSDVFVWDVQQQQLIQWTCSEMGDLSSDHLVAPTLINYPTFDQVNGRPRKISAFYFKPPVQRDRYPVMIYIHGGPESQFRPFFSPVFQFYLQELGIAILAPNVRGSSGYGKEFLALDNGYKREDSVLDIGKLIDWVEGQDELDHERIAVMGGSYGGYMVLASMAHFNHRLRCGIDIVGISNFITFLKNTKSYRRRLRRVEYGDERDPAMRQHLEKISPTTNAHKINKPIFIVQGQNDPRVPASEAEQMLRAIRNNGGEAWYLLAKDEGHGFRKKRNRDYFTQTVILFLQRYLLEY